MKIILTFSLMLFSFNTLAAVGVVSAIKGQASFLREDQKTPVSLNANVLEKDSINTDSKAKVQITFNDRTVVTIGQNSAFKVNEYLHETTENSKFQGTLTKGFMRTMSGQIGKLAPNRFKIKTETATIGIRGTIFTVQVTDDTTTVATLSGETYLQVDQTGETYSIPQNRQLTYNSQTGEVSESNVQNPGGTGDPQEQENESDENDGTSSDSSLENSNDDVTESVQDTEQAVQDANQNVVTEDAVAQVSTQNVLLSTLSETERDAIEASGDTLEKAVLVDQLSNSDSPFAYGQWLNNTQDSIDGYWAEGTLTQDTINAINSASDQNITAVYSVTNDQMSLTGNATEGTTMNITVNFGTGNVITGLILEIADELTGLVSGSVTDPDALLSSGKFNVTDHSVTSGGLAGFNASGHIDGQLVGTANAGGVPGGVTGTIDLQLQTTTPEPDVLNVEGSYGTSTVETTINTQ